MTHPETPAYLPLEMLIFAIGAVVLVSFLVWLIGHQRRLETDEAVIQFDHQRIADVYAGRVPPSPDDPVIEGYDDLGFGPAISSGLSAPK